MFDTRLTRLLRLGVPPKAKRVKTDDRPHGGVRWALLGGLCLAFAGCAVFAPATPPDDAPLLRLPPHALGRSLALRQHLTVAALGRTQQVDVLLEADAAAVRLALVNFGQTAARLEWDGLNLRETRSPWLPAAVSAERILSDLQLVLWPAEAVRATLPAGWTLQSDDAGRVLRHEGTDVTTVRFVDAARMTLVQHRRAYSLAIESHPAAMAASSASELDKASP